MNIVFFSVLIFLFLNFVLSILQIFKGRKLEDKLLAAQLMGTVGVSILLVLAASQKTTALIDAALIVAILSSVTLMAFVSYSWRSEISENIDGEDSDERG